MPIRKSSWLSARRILFITLLCASGCFNFQLPPSYILTDNGPLQQISGKVGETAMNVVHTFELVWIDAEENRTVLNPDNSEMLHDIFSELLAESRDNQ